MQGRDMNYKDKYGLWNVKPCVDGNPSGNDGWILTAYAQKVGFVVVLHELYETWGSLMCRGGFPIERLPNKPVPFVSRDVILGVVFLGLTDVKQLKRMGWNFSPRPLPELNIFKLIHQLWQLRGKHRNHFWQHPGFEQVYHVAFMVPLQDRAALYRFSGGTAPMLYRLIEWFDKRRKPENNSSALIRWLKYNQVPELKVFEEYFGEKHPMTRIMSVRK